ncbi:hypothetical protein HNR60_001531 [Rhodopseudomonas rhenobacensis]|uniref:Phage head morphogenesis domain-containing protein n=1 Tax=Rhodopseudomonas rhenobacensis TaxID=87461 RepID=A0A7W7Z2Q0_9BRAD|nr:phage minor head protein [Rhodopseudomonas rhenobacensis]MBB5046783.1 hypothetical protein [Rhodopseudomonas rhenobacensis]
MRVTRRQTLTLIARMAAVKRGMQTPPEILDYFRAKDLAPRFSWLDVWGEEHAHAFTVAGVTETRVLSDFRAAIDKALANGTGFEAFKSDIQSRLKPHGWWGPRQVADPEGKWKTKTVDFTRPGRLETTFWANVRSARAAGQWNRIQRTKASRPYLLYVRSTAERKRPEHLAVAGTIKPADDSWWSYWFPPNGWGCKCSVQQLDGEDRDRYLAQEGYSEDAPDLGAKTYVNRRTGEVTTIPRGIDPGWQTNPGLARARTLVSQLTGSLAEAGPERAAATIRKLWRGNWPKAVAKMDERVHLPVAASARVVDELDAKVDIVTVMNDVMVKKAGKHAAVDIESFALVQQIIDAGEWTEDREPAVRNILAVIGGVHWVLAIRRSSNGYIQVRTLFKVDARRHGEIRRREARYKAEGSE